MVIVCLAANAKQTTHKNHTTVNDTIRTINLQEVVKVARVNNKLKTAQLGMTFMDQNLIKSVPTLFGEADIIKALQLQPGVSAGIEGFAGMLVHGGENDENIFLIDGNPIYQMNHLGGLFSAYNTDAISNLSFYKAAFPARYGGRLSSVTDITMKSGSYEEYHGNFTLGLTSANLSIIGPIIKNKISFSAAIRRSWLELVSAPALAIINASKKKSGEKTIAGYNFIDFNLKVDYRMGKLGTLSLLGYYGYDKLKMGEHQFSTDKSEEASPYLRKDENRLGWGNFLTAVKWQVPINASFSYNVKTSFTRYNSNFKQNVESTSGVKGEAYYEYNSSYKEITNGISDIGTEASLFYSPTEQVTLRLGVLYTHHIFSPENVSRKTISISNGNDIIHNNLLANEWNCYIEGDIQPFQWLRANVGLRSSFFHINGKQYAVMEPRFSANFMLSPTVSLKAGYARMSQFVQQVSDNYISLPTDYWMPITEKFAPLISTQLSTGIYFSPNNMYVFSIEGYYKKMHNLLEYHNGYKSLPTDTPWEEKLTSGNGKSYGMDFQAEVSFGKVQGFLGYGLMWSNRLFIELNGGKRFPSKYDNRHKMTLSLTWPVSKHVELNGGWVYMTGNRATISLENYQYPNWYPTNITPNYPHKDEDMPSYYEGKNNVRLPAYHRLDLGINIYRPKKGKRMGVWNISVYNAYSRMNPIMIKKNNDKQTIDGVSLHPRFRKFSLFPIIPSVSYSYKF